MSATSKRLLLLLDDGERFVDPPPPPPAPKDAEKERTAYRDNLREATSAAATRRVTPITVIREDPYDSPQPYGARGPSTSRPRGSRPPPQRVTDFDPRFARDEPSEGFNEHQQRMIDMRERANPGRGRVHNVRRDPAPTPRIQTQDPGIDLDSADPLGGFFSEATPVEGLFNDD